MLHAQGPLLIPRARESEGFVPRRQLHCAGPRIFGQCDREHLEHDPVDVVLRLRLGKTQRVDLDSVSEASLFRVGDLVPLTCNRVPHLDESPHFAHFLDETDTRVDEEGHSTHHGSELFIRYLAGSANAIENLDSSRHRERDLLRWGRARLLQVIAADVYRIPMRHLSHRVNNHVLDET